MRWNLLVENVYTEKGVDPIIEGYLRYTLSSNLNSEGSVPDRESSTNGL